MTSEDQKTNTDDSLDNLLKEEPDVTDITLTGKAMINEDQKTDSDEAFDSPFKEEPGVTDLVLIVQGKKIFVNKTLLGMVSPVFKAMFESDFKEKHCSEVELPGKSFEDVVDFLRVIYPNVYVPLDFEMVIKVLPLLHEYDCQCQMKECQQFMLQNINPKQKDVDIDILLQCMQLSDMCDMQDVLDNCIEQGAKHASSLLTNNRFLKNVPAHVKERLYYKRLVMVECNGQYLLTKFYKICWQCRDNMKHDKKLELILDTQFQ